MIYKKKRSKQIMVTFVIALPVFFITTTVIEVPYTIKTISEVFPKEKWIVTKDNGEQIVSSIVDYTKGRTSNYNISQFERGEFVSIDFSRFITNRNKFSRGDTVIKIQSSDLTDKLISAKNDLAVATADLNSRTSSEKESTIKEAENKLNYAKEKHAEQKVLFDRCEKLYNKGFCSQQEFESQKWNLALSEIEIKINQAQLENLTTGVKNEEKQLLETKIEAAFEKLRYLKNKEMQMTVLSPIDGEILSTFSADTLLKVVNYDRVVLHLPVELKEVNEIHEGDLIKVEFPILNKIDIGNVIAVEKEVTVMNNKQVFFISLLLDNSRHEFLPGMLVETNLILKDISFLKQIKRVVNN